MVTPVDISLASGNNPVHPASRMGDPVAVLTPTEAESLNQAATKAKPGFTIPVIAVTGELKFEANPENPVRGRTVTVIDLSHEQELALPATISKVAM